MLFKKIRKLGSNNEATRHEWIKKTLENLTPGLKILDAGAGECQYKKYCTHLDYTSQDFAQYDGNGDKKGLQTGQWDNSGLDIISDITAIPKPANSYDAILCTEVFEHLPDPPAAIKEFSRLLKKGGHLIITAPFCSLTHFAPYHFYTGFNKYFYQHHLPANNFKIIEISPNGNYYEYIGQELKRIPSLIGQYTTSKKAGFLYKLYLYGIFFLPLVLLSRLNKKNNNSQELLNFGLHIHAIKQ